MKPIDTSPSQSPETLRDVLSRQTSSELRDALRETDLIKINLTNCAKFSTIRIVKKVIWDSVAKKAVRAFTIDVKREIGALLLSLQRGELLSMPQSRSMKSVHKSAFEFRVKDQSGIYRVFYVLFDGDKINPSCLYEKDSKDATKRN